MDLLYYIAWLCEHSFQLWPAQACVILTVQKANLTLDVMVQRVQCIPSSAIVFKYEWVNHKILVI